MYVKQGVCEAVYVTAVYVKHVCSEAVSEHVVTEQEAHVKLLYISSESGSVLHAIVVEYHAASGLGAAFERAALPQKQHFFAATITSCQGAR